jgi:hypothetical protein
MSNRISRRENHYAPSMRARWLVAILDKIARLSLTIFENRTLHASTVNTDTLQNIVKLNKTTRFGKQHRFDEIRAAGNPIALYKENIPLSRFPDYLQYIDDIGHGQANVLTTDKVDLFAGSSGTSTAAKRLPSTKRARRKFMFFVALIQQGVISRAFGAAKPERRGINLMSSNTPTRSREMSQPVMSANNEGLKSIRKIIPVLWSSPAMVFEIEHQPTAYYLHALFGLADRRIADISAVFIPHLTALFSIIEENKALIVSDIDSGTVASHLQLSPTERIAIESQMIADPIRAKQLSAQFKKGFRGIVSRVWPELKYIACITSGSFSIYTPRLKYLTDDRVPVYSPCHAASEGMVGVNLAPERDDYVLALGSAFFEFIPLTDSDSEQPETTDIDDLEVGKEYEVVLTSFAGLYRYRLDDVIRIMGFHGRAPIFKFLYRRGAILNLVGEKTTECHTARAVTASVHQWLGPNGTLRDYTVTIEINDGLSCYAFFAELEIDTRLHEGSSSNAATILDHELCKANHYYWSNGRNCERLGPVKLHLVKRGTFDSLTQMQNSRSGDAVSSQTKIPRVIREPEQIALLKRRVFFTSVGAEKTTSVAVTKC